MKRSRAPLKVAVFVLLILVKSNLIRYFRYPVQADSRGHALKCINRTKGAFEKRDIHMEYGHTRRLFV